MSNEVSAEALELIRAGVEALKAIIQKHQYELEKLTDLLKRITRDQSRINRILLGDGNGEGSVKMRLIEIEYRLKDNGKRIEVLEHDAGDIDDLVKRRVEDEFLRRGALEHAEEVKATRAFKGKVLLQIMAHVAALVVALIALAKN